MNCLALAVTCSALLAQTAETPSPHLWRPVSDPVYLQEIGEQVATDTPIFAVAVFQGQCYVGQADGLRVLEGSTLVPVGGPRETVRRLETADGALWAVTPSALHRFDGKSWQKVAEGEFYDLCMHLGAVHVASNQGIHRVDGDTLVQVEHAKTDRRVLAVASYSGTLYCLLEGRLALLDPVVEKGFDQENVWDWSTPMSRTLRDLHAQGSRLYIATDDGIGLLRGMALTVIRGRDGLPIEDVRSFADGFDGDLWIATSGGAVRAVNGEYHYFGATRWLPSEPVNAIACGDRVVYIATDGGLGIIRYEPYTLLKKAAYYERHLEEWGQKRLGFTHKLEWDATAREWVREVSDNDVGWSTHYLAAMCFKYAVTRDPRAREEAVDFFQSVLWSEEITGIPGFPARSIWAIGERGHQAQHGSGGLPAEWHNTPDGLWQWKGDTSSDEIDAHFYAVPIFDELVANEREKVRAAEHLRRIAKHIKDNGWVLRDVDGKPTRWGRWDPEYLDTPYGFYARGLNGMEALNYMHTAYAITGDAQFQDGLNTLLERRYQNEVLRVKLTFPPGFIFHSDDRLAFYTYYSLLKYTTDPALRSIYRRSLDRSWEVERIEHVPWFNFIYGALTGNDCELEPAVRHLREWPLDLVAHRYHNSHRADLDTPPGYVPYSGGTRAISPRESGPCRWTDNRLNLDGGSGQEVVDPSGWLDAYWMGRYYGFIEAPEVDSPELTTVPESRRRVGAQPYDGPPRPPIRLE